MRARRLELGLLQKDVAERIGASTASLTNWEVNRRKPAVGFLPRIISFLGYDPTAPGPDSELAQQLAAVRRSRGLSQRELGRLLGIDEGTVRLWEAGQGRVRPSTRVARKVREFLAGR